MFLINRPKMPTLELIHRSSLLLAIQLLCCASVGFSSGYRAQEWIAQSSGSGTANPLLHRIRIAQLNTASSPPLAGGRPRSLGKFVPGQPASAFKLPTLDGSLVYPGPVINRTTPVIFHSYNPDSAFLRCLWNCSGSVEDFVTSSPADVHYVFMSSSNDAIGDVTWMRARLKSTALKHEKLHPLWQWTRLADRLHFVTVSTWKLRDLGIWIPDLLQEWTCQDHNCGLDQVVIEGTDLRDVPLTLPRLDAHYDWLPSPETTFNNRTLPAKVIGDGCAADAGAKGVIAIVSEKNCDYFVKFQAMAKSGSLGVLVLQDVSPQPPDMNCKDDECSIPLNIPASTIPNHSFLKRDGNVTIRYQNIASENFFAAIDEKGQLAEVGWLLHPSLVYLPWQAQWFDYKRQLDERLSSKVLSVNVFNNSVMQGDKGASVNVTLPPLEDLRKYGELQLDFSLSCPGERDEECPHWDRTIQVFVCCKEKSDLCGAELGRWISPFRRRIGRWLTSVGSLIPLLETKQCTFMVTGATSGELWMPTLNLRFSQSSEGLHSERPSLVKRWISGTFTFNKNYNKIFKEFQLQLAGIEWKRVKIFSVITGHGSDENGCGEFCVTSHQFVVNNRHLYNMTFHNAGTPLGCAERVLLGVEPNEHGTWLYGRNGWCDGQQVDPWVIDITNDLDPTSENTIKYFGWFRGGDPDPKQNPGVITINAYVAVYA